MCPDRTRTSVFVRTVLFLGSCLCVFAAPTFADTYTLTSDAVIDPNNTTYDGHDIVVDGCVVTIDGEHSFASLSVTNSGIVTHTVNADTQVYMLDLTITNDVTVDAGSAIDVNGRGYASVQGPGAGVSDASYGSGAGYGGGGGRSAHVEAGGPYGDIIAPTEIGSGGGNGVYATGGFGGGAIRLDVGGTLTVDGVLTAAGNNGGTYSGGGSGGSIHLTVDTLAGTGAISVNGGLSGQATYSGSGGGGRIAIEYTTDAFEGAISATAGANGYQRGGAGTIFTKPGAAAGDLLIDNGGNSGAWTPITSPEAFNVMIANGAIVYPTEVLTIGDLDVAAGGLLTHMAGSTVFDLTVQGDANIDAAGAISVNGRGYGSDTGPGAGVHAAIGYGSGAGYGGEGGDCSGGGAGGIGYGSILAPAELGSGGGYGNSGSGGIGGGAIRLDVAGTLTVDGNLTADGNNGGTNSGGGSGGSIHVTVGTLDGTGVISANGGLTGQPTQGGAGGGGRIAIEYTSDSFVGTVSAVGGANGWEMGGAGTIYRKDSAAAAGDLLLDNGGAVGARTTITSPEAFDLTIANGAIVYPTEALTIDDLDVAAGGLMTHAAGSTALDVTVQGDVDIDLAGAITADGRGYGSDTGPGAGVHAAVGYGSGAGYGGEGGDCNGGGAGGIGYGSILAPAELGSGGGYGSGGSGGVGGGAIRLDVAGTLTVDGNLTADGNNGGANSGGGSGGSIHMTVGTLEGTGVISANGGLTGQVTQGGAGGGGRIAIEYTNDSFTGVVSAVGGANGWEMGGAGTIYRKDSAAAVGDLLLDNGGAVGAWTTITSPEAFDLTIANGAIVYPTAALIVKSLHVAANGLLTHPNEAAGFEVAVQNDAAIDVDGALAVDGRGYAAQTGPGAGQYGSGYGSGAGYGGAGGDCYANLAAGGDAYDIDLVVTPSEFGSGGASGSGSTGGAGGGAVRLIVNGVLTIDGRLSADGAAGYSSNGGGGSGGCFHLTVGTLAGSGVVSANGGAGGHVGYAGGGGGGRIAVVADSSSFSGTITAYGGPGWMCGGAGSVYVMTGAGPAELTYINDGASGAWTPITTPTVCDMVVGAGAIVHPNDMLTVNDLHVMDGGTMTHESGYEDFYLRIQGDATVDVGGAIQADAKGYGPAAGPGAGRYGGGYASGAGYGGRGGDAQNHFAIGGDTYGVADKPEDLGSGGASGSSSTGGRGGGFLRITTAGTLQVEGVISVNGGGGSGTHGGGGSGGGMFIKAGAIGGAGTISANGGAGGNPSYAGGGGGGRIAVFTCDLLMSMSNITATGGAGWENGDDGTIEFGSSTVDITEPPVDQIVLMGTPLVTFTVSAIGDGELSYQWRYNDEDLIDGGRISGAQTDTLAIADIEFCDIGEYYVVVTDDCGAFPSETARLYISDSGDLDGDADVDLSDLAQLLGNYGITSGATWDQGDINGNGGVELSDLAALLAVYGTSCP